jgi:uncharacterized protein YbcI
MKPTANQLENELSEIIRKYKKKETGGLKNFSMIMELTRDSSIEDASFELDRLEKEGKMHPNLIDFGRIMIQSRENARNEK